MNKSSKKMNRRSSLFFCLIVVLVLFAGVVQRVSAQEDHGEMDSHDHDHNHDHDEYGGGGYGGSGGGPGAGGDGGSRGPKELDSVEDINKFVSEGEEQAVIVGYFDPSNASDKEVFMSVANSHSSTYKFAYTTNKDVLEQAKYDGCTVVVHKPIKFLAAKHGEKPKARYPSKSLKEDSLKRFIFDKAVPLVGEKSFKTADVYDNLKMPVVTVFADVDHAKNPKGWTYLSNRVLKVAKELQGKFAFTVADKDDYSYLLEDYGLSMTGGAKSDVSVGLKVTGAGPDKVEMYYKMEGKFTSDALKQFVADYREGKLVGKEKEPYKPPAPAPDGDAEFDPAVVTLTDDNFQSEVEDSLADVMLEFYAPWCGHCKALKPEYSALARDFAGDSGVKIAAMDSTAHTPPSKYQVSGYPTLYWLPADKKEPISYDGEREFSAMKEWIEKHRTTTKSA